MSLPVSQVDLISKLLDVAILRQRVIGQNIANVNTPGYRQREVVFEQQLHDLLAGGESGETMVGLEAEVREARGLTARSDGNNVDIDLEMGRLTKNSLLYQTYSQILATKLGMLRSAIGGQP
jgi:flagellar basal-body rod protein FlgB